MKKKRGIRSGCGYCVRFALPPPERAGRSPEAPQARRGCGRAAVRRPSLSPTRAATGHRVCAPVACVLGGPSTSSMELVGLSGAFLRLAVLTRSYSAASRRSVAATPIRRLSAAVSNSSRVISMSGSCRIDSHASSAFSTNSRTVVYSDLPTLSKPAMFLFSEN
eukprot:scaffold1785_cov95-Isochrysis_galbana.AAC.3